MNDGMSPLWWEAPIRIVCNWWWLLLALFVIALALFFTRNIWMPLVGLGL